MSDIINTGDAGREAAKKPAAGGAKKLVKTVIIVLIIAALVVGAVFAGLFYYGRSKSIDADQAVQTAMADAGLSDSAVSKCHFGLEDGMFCYEVKLYSGGIEYEYKIHAESGVILEKDVDGVHSDYYVNGHEDHEDHD